MKLAWATDIHVDHASGRLEDLIEQSKSANSILLTGDISTADRVEEVVTDLAMMAGKPIYFICGNHDYWHAESKLKFRKELDKIEWASFLTTKRPFKLTKDTYLTGVCGLADAGYGEYQNSTIVLNDVHFITELHNANKKDKKWRDRHLTFRFSDLWKSQLGSNRPNLYKAMQSWGKADGKLLNTKLKYIEKRKAAHAIVALHAPPFPSVTRYNENPTDPDFLPFYSCKSTGDVLREHALQNPQIQYTVLCGHTHSKAELNIFDNLKVIVGQAHYGHPEINSIIEL